MPGLEVVDRYTLRIRLKAPDYNFAYLLAMPATSASAREAVERYGLDYGSNPVGTGAYQLLRSEYKRASKTVLVKNPNYRKSASGTGHRTLPRIRPWSKRCGQTGPVN